MKELEKQLAELVRKGIEVAEKTGEFVIEQAPDLLQEFYRWHMVKNSMSVVIGILIALLIFAAFKAVGSKEKQQGSALWDFDSKILGRYYDEVGGWMLLLFGVGVGGGASLIWALSSLYDVIFILVAPKLYLIEYFLN